MPETMKKVLIKLLDKPLKGKELTEYAVSKKMKFGGFSDHTALIGEIYEDKKMTGLLGMEIEPWADYSSFHHNYDLLNRMRIKLFSRGGKRIGVIEERLIKELSMPTSSHKIPLFTAILKDLPYAVDLDKDSDKFVFAVLTDTRKKILEIFQMSKKTFRLSYEVKRKYLIEKIASIKSKWGGKIEIKIYEEELARKESFLNLLILFAGTIKYHDEIESKIRTFSNSLSEGTLIIKPTRRAIELMSKASVEVYAEADKAKASAAAAKAKAIAPKEVKPAPEMLTLGQRMEAGYRGKRRKIRGAPRTVPVDLTVVPAKGKPAARTHKRRKPSPPVKETPASFTPAEPPLKGPILKMPKTVVPKKPPKEVKLKFPPLQLEDSVKSIMEIPKDMAEILEEVGIEVVDDLIFIDPGALAEFIGIQSMTKAKIKELQDTAHKQLKETIKIDKELKAKYLEKYKDHADKDKSYL